MSTRNRKLTATATSAVPTAAAVPSAAPAAGLLRRVGRRARRELAGWRRTTVREPGARPVTLRGQRLRLILPDAGALVRIAGSGQLTGQIRQLDLELVNAPESQLIGVRPPRLGRTAVGFSWRRRGRYLSVRLRWTRPYEVHRALEDALRSVLRSRPWDQTSGPVYALDGAAWRAGRWSWPQGRLVATPPVAETDELGRPMGPYLPVPPGPGTAGPGTPGPRTPERATRDPGTREPEGTANPVVTAVANPFGRKLFGAATAYRLVRSAARMVLRDTSGRVVWHADPASGPEAALARSAITKYAVVSVDAPVPVGDRFGADCLRVLAACGMVFATPDPATRASLDALGLVTVADPAVVADLPGYALSVEAARRMALTGDPALRRTELGVGARDGGTLGDGTLGGGTLGGGDGVLPLPGITAVISTKRAEHLPTVLDYLAAQTYPALEVVIGLHGYELPEAERERLSLRFPVRVVAFPAEQTFGSVLGRLSRIADGELVTKLDDDDHYGPNHVTDLFIAWHTSGADLVAKGARFVHFPERDETIDRAWAAPELFDVTPAGGTMLLSRGALAEVGGWSHAPKHVDADLLARVRSAGGVVYRTHALEYVYVRRSDGHTFVAEVDELLAHGERTYPGLPPEILRPGYAPQVPV